MVNKDYRMIKKNNSMRISILLFVFLVTTVIAGEKIHIYLLAGQSNMLGRKNISDTDPLLVQNIGEGGIASNTIAYHHNYRGSETLATNGFSTLKPRPPDDGQGGNFGSELTFGRDMQGELGNEKIAILKYAVGGTSLYGDWYADGTDDQSNDGEKYTEFKQLVNAGLAELRNNYPNAKIQVEAMLWHQGEADVGTKAAYYETNLTHFIHDVRQDLHRPYLPFFIGGLSDLQRDYYEAQNRLAWMEMLIKAQKDVAKADPESWFVSLDAANGMSISSDGLHFDVNGYKKMGERFREVLLAANASKNKYVADIEALPTGIVSSATAIGDFYSYVAAGTSMTVVEEATENNKLSIPGDGISRIYLNTNTGFTANFDLSFDFSVSETGNGSRGSRILVIKADLADGTSGHIVSEIAIGDRGVSATGCKLMYTDASTTRTLAAGYLITDNTEYTMHVWSDHEDKKHGKYNITVTLKAGGNPVYDIAGIDLLINGSSILQFSTIVLGQYSAESIECTLDNICFSSPFYSVGTAIIIN